jgi:hypothetical protein
VHIHSRDSASIDFAARSGSTARKSFWMKDIDSSHVFPAPIRNQFENWVGSWNSTHLWHDFTNIRINARSTFAKNAFVGWGLGRRNGELIDRH